MKYDREQKKFVEYTTTREVGTQQQVENQPGLDNVKFVTTTESTVEIPETTTPDLKAPKSKSVFREVLGPDSLRFDKGDYIKIAIRDRMNTVTHRRPSSVKPTFRSMRISGSGGDEGGPGDDWLTYLELDSSTQTYPLELEIGPYNDMAPFPMQGSGLNYYFEPFPMQEEDLEPEHPKDNIEAMLNPSRAVQPKKRPRTWNAQTKNLDAMECRFKSKVHSMKKQQLLEWHQEVLAKYCRERCDVKENSMRKCKQRLEIKPGNLLGKKCESCCHAAMRSFRKTTSRKITNRRVCIEI